MLNEQRRKEIAENILNYTICDENENPVEQIKEGRYQKWGGGLAYLIDFRTNTNYQNWLKDKIKELEYVEKVKIVEVEKEYMVLELYTNYSVKEERIIISVDDMEYDFILVEWGKE